MNNVVTARFRYNGVVRHLTNVKFENGYLTVIGNEKRNSGRFSFKVKRFKVSKMREVSFTLA